MVNFQKSTINQKLILIKNIRQNSLDC